MFYFRLALRLGMTVQEMLRKLDSAELTEWRAFFRLEEEAAAPPAKNAAAAVRASLAHRVKKKGKT